MFPHRHYFNSSIQQGPNAPQAFRFPPPPDRFPQQFSTPPPRIPFPPRQQSIFPLQTFQGVPYAPSVQNGLPLQQCNSGQRFSSFPPMDAFSIPPPIHIPPPVEYVKLGKENTVDPDELWLSGFLQNVTSRQSNSASKCSTNHSTSVWQFGEDICTVVKLLDDMDQLLRRFRAGHTDSQTRTRIADLCIQKQQFINQIITSLENKDKKDVIKEKLKRMGKRRERKKKGREREQQRRREIRKRREVVHHECDALQRKLKKDSDDAKRMVEMKKSAKLIFGEVQRKITEAKSNLKLLSTLRKLREVRKNKMKGNMQVVQNEEMFGQQFDTTTDNLELLWQNQLRDYSTEKQALEVLVGDHHYRATDPERPNPAKNDSITDQQTDDLAAEIRVSYFGNEPLEGDPLYSYYRNATVAERDIDELVLIRRQWDAYIGPATLPRDCAIPSGWVQPVSPSGDGWGKFLAK